MDNFLPCLSAVWQFDGLRNDQATGETFATSFGVTAMTWKSAVNLRLVSGSIDNATKAQCETILRGMYWVKCHCPDLPLGVDLMCFNDAMLTGVSHAAGLLQRCVDVKDDGVIGPITLLAVRGIQPELLISKLRAADEKYLSELHNAPLYLRGWDRREQYMASIALKMGMPKPG